MKSYHLTLREQRERRNMSQLELAARADTSLTTVIDIEANARIPTVDTAQRLATVLGVRVDDLAWPTRATVQRKERRAPRPRSDPPTSMTVSALDGALEALDALGGVAVSLG